MKRSYYLMALMFFSSQVLMAQNGKITDDERKFIMDYLDVTQTNLIATINNLDEEKWSYRPSSGGWTVAECMKHILVAEEAVFGQLKNALKSEADNSMNLKNQDAWLISKISDRGVKVKTPLPPTEGFKTKKEAIEALQNSRKEIIKFLKNKDLPLRNHFGRSPYGPADAYQLLIVIAAHSMRHNAQIDEILTELVN